MKTMAGRRSFRPKQRTKNCRGGRENKEKTASGNKRRKKGHDKKGKKNNRRRTILKKTDERSNNEQKKTGQGQNTQDKNRKACSSDEETIEHRQEPLCSTKNNDTKATDRHLSPKTTNSSTQLKQNEIHFSWTTTLARDRLGIRAKKQKKIRQNL